MPWDDPGREGGASPGGLYKRIWQLTGRTPGAVDRAVDCRCSTCGGAAPLSKGTREWAYVWDFRAEKVLSLGAQFAAIMLLNILLKFLLQYRGALLGEEVVRRIRARIVRGYTRDRHLAPGTVASVLTAEAEGVGQFVGEAIATPLVQIGTLISVLLYIGASNRFWGLLHSQRWRRRSQSWGMCKCE